MTIQELDKEILLRKDELEAPNKRRAYQYITEFMEENDIDNILDFVYVDIWGLINCNLYINCEEKNMDKYIKTTDTFNDFFDGLKVDGLKEISSLVTNVLNNGKIDELINFFKVKGFMIELKYFGLFGGCCDNKSIIMLRLLKKKIESENLNIIPFLEMVKSEKEKFIDEINYYITYRKVLDHLQNSVIKIFSDSTDERVIKAKKVAAITSRLENFFDVDEIVSKMNKVKEFKDEYERVERNSQREINGLDLARSSLEKELSKKQIVNYRDLIKGIKNPKMKYLFLNFIKEHNELYYEELQQELISLKKDSKVSIQALFNDYGIHKELYDYDSLPTYTKEEFELILKTLSVLNICNEEKIRIINNTTIDKINVFKSYLDRKIIPVEFASNNTYILDEDSNELDNLNVNIEVLKDFNVSVSLFSNSVNILMNDPYIINENLKVLESYNLLGQLNNTIDLNFLLSDNLETIIDKYLELGFEEYLENDLNLLNKKELNRLEIIKTIGMNIASREELEHILDDKKFFISSIQIEDYLSNDSMYVEEPSETVELDKLEQYKHGRVYDFNGVKISIEKVNRLTYRGVSLYQAIISNTHLSEDELLGICKIINNGIKKELRMD